jgi:hypothetical protein
MENDTARASKDYLFGHPDIMPAIERDACNSTVERVFVGATLLANTHTPV